jgi:hypothetical protein
MPRVTSHSVRAFTPTLVAAAALAAAGCGSSGSEPAAQHSPGATAAPAAAAPQKFASQRYGFRVTLRNDWSEQDATQAWNGKRLEGIGSSDFANFTNRGGRALVAAAARVPKATRLAQWRAAMVRAAPDFCTESSSARRTTLGGEPALAWTAACSDGYKVNKIAALHGRRGYMVFLPSPTGTSAAGDRRMFESIRRSFRFTA